MKINDQIIALMIVLAVILSFFQIEFASEKYYLFVNEYNQQLWTNRVSDSVFAFSYIITFTQIILGYIFLFRKRNNLSKIVRIVLGMILIFSVTISIAASTWLFVMEEKHILVKYSEWIMYNKGLLN